MKEDHRRSAEEQPLKEVIEKFLKAYAWDGKMKEMDLVAAWPELMGIAVANRTKEIRIQNKKLFLTIDSSVMREELLLGKQIIIDRLNEYAGQEIVTDIWFA
jgi:predicted nucleic acid-binding Zn ribbon protein